MMNAPTSEVSVSARVEVDPRTLTTDGGIARVNRSVAKAARQVCAAADALSPSDDACVRSAIKSAQPQLDALIAHAKSVAHG